jgi:flagellar biosynthesis protein FliQ
MTDPTAIIDIGRNALVISMVISGPLLVAGLVVGLVIGVFQAVTQIHEMTLTFVPKIIAIIGVLIFLLPWMVIKMVDYTVDLFDQIPTLIG